MRLGCWGRSWGHLNEVATPTQRLNRNEAEMIQSTMYGRGIWPSGSSTHQAKAKSQQFRDVSLQNM